MTALSLSPEEARAWYPESDPVHGFDHVLRVYQMAERLAMAEGADLEIVRAAVLLHDAQPALSQSDLSGDPTPRHNHHQTSAEFAREILLRRGWTEERIAAVQHCIRTHRFRDRAQPPESLEAQVVFDADKLDAIGAIGVARAVAFAARAGQPFYAPASETFTSTGRPEPQEAHSAYHEFLFKLSKLKDCLYTAAARALAEERHRFMVHFFEQLGAEVRGAR